MASSDGKPLPRKADELIGVLVENPNQLKGQRVELTEDSTWGLENCPKYYFKYNKARRRNQKRLQVQRLHINDQT